MRFGSGNKWYFFILILPAFTMLIIFIVLPIIQSISMSFYRIISSMSHEKPVFVGFRNYMELGNDPVAIHSLWVTMVFVAVSTFFEMAIGLLLALLMHVRSSIRGILRVFILIPWAIPTVVSAQMWRFHFNDGYGIVNYLLFGTQVERFIPWLASPATALWAIIIADIWKTSSFSALIILAGLQMIPLELYESAKVDGAGVWRRFYHITWPLIRPALLVALLFRTIDAFRVFDLAFVMTQGGPADATNVLQLYGYKKMFMEGLMGYGSAISVGIFIIIFILSIFYVRIAGRRMLEGSE